MFLFECIALWKLYLRGRSACDRSGEDVYTRKNVTGQGEKETLSFLRSKRENKTRKIIEKE